LASPAVSSGCRLASHLALCWVKLAEPLQSHLSWSWMWPALGGM
jgi:hypothetical protein